MNGRQLRSAACTEAGYLYRAVALAAEIDLNRLAAGLQSASRYSWDEPLLVDPVSLTISSAAEFAAPRIYLYSFGVVVFFNCPEASQAAFFDRFAASNPLFARPDAGSSHENYSMQICPGQELAVTNDGAQLPQELPVCRDIIASILAMSVALEQIEAGLDKAFDGMEELIARLERGKLALSDRVMARSAATILNFRHRSLASIMILDKPEITWESEEADRLYSALANLFELNQRYRQLRHKADTLLDINGVFTGLSHARRSARLEWIIIVLIAIEIALFLLEMFRK